VSKVGVLIVEDSLLFRTFLVDVVNADERLIVVGAVESAEQALHVLDRLQPQVISMDICLPGMSGVEATRRIMAERPTPVVVVAADLRSESVNRSMEALRAGALTAVEKPTAESAEAFRELSRQLCDQFFYMSQVKVIRRRFDGAGAPAGPSASPPPRAWPAGAQSRIAAVGVVASTGGPKALTTLLNALPASLAAPVLLVQHIGSRFVEGFAQWLGSVCRLDVVLAQHGQSPEPGVVYVAPSGVHLTWAGDRLRLVRGAPIGGHCPSGDALFESLAASLKERAVGVLLTGMGEDGARGLLEMRRAGAYTIGQDEATSTVYGMPGAAARLDAVAEQLPLGEIAERITQLLCTTRKSGDA
jgi:two-component system, chemotaxis family, protein-glutamate methylesterase/glutaminase